MKSGERTWIDLNRETLKWLSENATSELDYNFRRGQIYDTLEALVQDGWIEVRHEEGYDAAPPYNYDADPFVHLNRDLAPAS